MEWSWNRLGKFLETSSMIPEVEAVHNQAKRNAEMYLDKRKNTNSNLKLKKPLFRPTNLLPEMLPAPLQPNRAKLETTTTSAIQCCPTHHAKCSNESM
jgi:hypothetical protein